MEEQKKWYAKILKFLLIVVFSPVIICFILWGGLIILTEWLKTPLYKKQYQQSAYYQDMKIQYRRFIIDEPSYHFYNAAREQNIPIKLVHQENNDLDYIIDQESIYLFPFFDQMAYNDEKQHWEINCDGDWALFDESMDKQIALINDNHSEFPVYLLLSEYELAPREIFDDSMDEIEDGDYARALLPPYVKMGKNHLSAFVGET